MVVLSSIIKQAEQAMIKLHPSMAPAVRFLPFVGSCPPPQLPSWSRGVIIAIVTLTKTLTYSLIYLLLSIFKFLIIFICVCMYTFSGQSVLHVWISEGNLWELVSPPTTYAPSDRTEVVKPVSKCFTC